VRVQVFSKRIGAGKAVGMREGSEAMSELQKAIYGFVKSKGRVTREEVRESFSLPEREMQRQLAILRHCELVKGHKEDDKVYLTPFR
jgi:predicted HTH transcriptional regulator